MAWNKEDVEEYGKYGRPEFDLLFPEIFRMLYRIKGRKIADYGCGKGELLEDLHKRGAVVHGFDISKSMIEESKKKMPNANLAVVDSGKIPLPDSSLDAVVTNLVLMMIQDGSEIEKIFKETYRVLKSGGLMVNCITHPAFVDREGLTYRNIFEEERDYFREGQPYQFVLVKPDGSEATNPNFIDYHHSISTYLNLLARSGLTYSHMEEVEVPGEKFPHYMIIKSKKNN